MRAALDQRSMYANHDTDRQNAMASHLGNNGRSAD
jgi:hypothetical protein